VVPAAQTAPASPASPPPSVPGSLPASNVASPRGPIEPSLPAWIPLSGPPLSPELLLQAATTSPVKRMMDARRRAVPWFM
jgi:hypothetical protein